MTAGLQSIPRDLYESAFVDGAGGWRRFTNVTVPLLGADLLFAIVVLTIRALQTYGEIDLLTGGGPQGDDTTTVTYLIYGRNSVIAFDNGPAGDRRRAAVPHHARRLAHPVPRPGTAGALWLTTVETALDRVAAARGAGSATAC